MKEVAFLIILLFAMVWAVDMLDILSRSKKR